MQRLMAARPHSTRYLGRLRLGQLELERLCRPPDRAEQGTHFPADPRIPGNHPLHGPQDVLLIPIVAKLLHQLGKAALGQSKIRQCTAKHLAVAISLFHRTLLGSRMGPVKWGLGFPKPHPPVRRRSGTGSSL